MTEGTGSYGEDSLKLEVEALRDLKYVVYGNSPLTREESQRRLELILRKQPGSLQDLQCEKKSFSQSPREAIEHEWGLGISRTAPSEAILIIGDATGVNWTDQLVKCLIPVAHTHPYLTGPKVRDRYGRVSTETKEIADHEIGTDPAKVNGAVLWNQLADRSEHNEMLKIFPSGLDVTFAATKGIETHTVYTPYLVLNHSEEEKRAIANPEFAGKNPEFVKANPALAATQPLLSFEINNAEFKGETPSCQLVAMANGNRFWTKDITVDGKGEFSRPKW